MFINIQIQNISINIEIDREFNRDLDNYYNNTRIFPKIPVAYNCEHK
jgi:hypothetical protein